MIHIALTLVAFIILSTILWVCVIIGRSIGMNHLKDSTEKKLEVVGAAESAVFGLLALMIAFTFAGAFDRFEARKIHLMEEATAFERAYEYINLVSPKYQTILRTDMRQFLDIQIMALHHTPLMKNMDADLEISNQLQKRMWESAVKGCEENKNQNLVSVVLPAFSSLFESAQTGINIKKVHPPAIIFVLLIVLSGLGAFLIGYNSAENRHKRPLHSLSYVVLTSFIIYVILNMEFPRLGAIHMTTFDQMLVDVREHMNDGK